MATSGSGSAAGSVAAGALGLGLPWLPGCTPSRRGSKLVSGAALRQLVAPHRGEVAWLGVWVRPPARYCVLKEAGYMKAGKTSRASEDGFAKSVAASVVTTDAAESECFRYG
jgi:hypothetical protein